MTATSAAPDRIAALLSEYPVFDGHNDVAWALRKQSNYDLDAVDLALPQPSLHTDIPRLRAGGVGAQFFSVYVPSNLPGSAAVTATLEQIDCVQRIVARHLEVFEFATTAGEVRAAMRSGRIAALLGAEGGHSIDNSLPTLRVLRRLGVAYMTLTHNHNTPWADSATDEPNSGGLTDFGRAVVAEMNRIGMLVDLSHVAVSTMTAALQASTAPVIFSHSSCRALCDNVRDVPDEVLAALAGNGGVVMVTFVPGFVSQECSDHYAAAKAEAARLRLPTSTVYTLDEPPEEDPAARLEYTRWEADHPQPLTTLRQVADHVEHARDVAGIDHIGLGGDYDGVDGLPVGLEDVSCYPALLVELADRGWSNADLAALTCENILRVLQAAQDVAEPAPWR